jgi:tRNA-splicing endonuclease subunit Sen54
MHNALSFQRIHPNKTHNIGTYHPETNMAYVNNPRGPILPKLGHVLSAKDDPLGAPAGKTQRLWLLPEEAIYCLERGSLDIRWPKAEDADDQVVPGEDDDEEYGLPMSLQAVYAMFLGDGSSERESLTLERYNVYANLKRMGYLVFRAPSWHGIGDALGDETFPPLQQPPWQLGLRSPWSLLQSFFFSGPPGASTLSPPSHTDREGPIIAPGVYRNYATIYRKLALIPFHDPTNQHRPQSTYPLLPQTSPDFRITYHVYKPSATNFKKSAPGPPDFRIAVINARETGVPTLEDLSRLMETTPYDPPIKPASKPPMALPQKLKHGYRNVTLAVVDQGVISYLRVADAAFGLEKLYLREAKGAGAKNRGGGGGGRGGRGGGRGGRGRGGR